MDPRSETYQDGWERVHRRLFESSRWWSGNPYTRLLLMVLIIKAQDPMNPEPGTVTMGPTALANLTGIPVEDVKAELHRLCQPDPESRTAWNGGRTLEALPGGYRLLNVELYHPHATANAAVKKAARVE